MLYLVTTLLQIIRNLLYIYIYNFTLLHYLQFKFTVIYFFPRKRLKQRVNIICNTFESLDFVLESDNEDIGKVVGNNDSSDSSKYEEDKNDNVSLIRNN